MGLPAWLLLQVRTLLEILLDIGGVAQLVEQPSKKLLQFYLDKSRGYVWSYF